MDNTTARHQFVTSQSINYSETTLSVTSSYNLSVSGSTSTSPYECKLDRRLYRTVEMVLITISLPFNLFLCLSLFIYRHKLRRNSVNIYAANVLVANLMSCLFHLISVYLSYFGPEKMPMNNHENISNARLIFWFINRGLILVMFLVIAGGISLMVVALRNNLFRIHRTVAGVSRNSITALNPHKDKSKVARPNAFYRYKLWARTHHRLNAYLQIFVTWLVPVVFAVVLFTDYHCLYNCTCVLDYVPTDPSVSACPFNQGCNSLWNSTSNISVIVGTTFWLVYVAILIGCLARSFISFRHMIKERRLATMAQLSNQGSIVESTVHNEPTNQNGADRSSAEVENGEGNSHQATFQSEKNDALSRPNTRHDISSSLLLESLRKNLSFIVAIAVIFVLGNGVVAILGLITSIDPMDLTFMTQNDYLLIPFMSTYIIFGDINSILLCFGLLGLRSAVKSLARATVTCSCVRK